MKIWLFLDFCERRVDFVYFKGRAKRKMDELKRLLDVAKMNYQQLGGELQEDKIKQEEEKESAR